MITALIVLSFVIVALIAIPKTREYFLAATVSLGAIGFVLYWILVVASSVVIPIAIVWIVIHFALKYW